PFSEIAQVHTLPDERLRPEGCEPLLVRIVEDALALLPIVGERLADRGATDAAVVHRPFELVHHLSLVGLLDKVHRPAIARVRLAYPLLEAAQILAVIVGELATSGRHDA